MTMMNVFNCGLFIIGREKNKYFQRGLGTSFMSRYEN